MTAAEVKKKIKEKFGSISNFSKLSLIDRYELQKCFMAVYADSEHYKIMLAEIDAIASNLEYQPVNDKLTEQQSSALKSALIEYGGINKFCKDNPDFSRASVFQILAGDRAKVTKTAKKLMAHFKIE